MPKTDTPRLLPDADPVLLETVLNSFEDHVNKSLTKIESQHQNAVLFQLINEAIPHLSETEKASYFVRIKAIGLMIIKFQDELVKSGHIRIHPNGFDAGVGIHRSLFKLIANYEIQLTPTGKTDAAIDVNIDHLFELAQASIPFSTHMSMTNSMSSMRRCQHPCGILKYE